MAKKTRVWVYLPDYLEAVIKRDTAGKGDQGSSTSAWIVTACDHYLKSRDLPTDEQLAQERSRHDLEIKKRNDMIAALENDVKVMTAAREVLEGKVKERDTIAHALEESQRDRQGLQMRVEMIDASIKDKERELSDYRGLLVETQRNLSTALNRIPAIPESTEHKPRWWEFWKGRA
jgi:hypothetical protein